MSANASAFVCGERPNRTTGERLDPYGLRCEPTQEPALRHQVIMQWVDRAKGRPTSPVRERSVESVEQSVRQIRRPRGGLRRDLGSVLALGGLLGHAQHRSDFRPRTLGIASIADRVAHAVSTSARCSTSSTMVRSAAATSTASERRQVQLSDPPMRQALDYTGTLQSPRIPRRAFTPQGAADAAASQTDDRGWNCPIGVWKYCGKPGT
jgi:hypothetical protein